MRRLKHFLGLPEVRRGSEVARLSIPDGQIGGKGGRGSLGLSARKDKRFHGSPLLISIARLVRLKASVDWQGLRPDRHGSADANAPNHGARFQRK